MYFDLDTSPTLSLLHKRHAAVFLSFFHKSFRGEKTDAIPEERLESWWESFIENEVAQSDWEGEAPTNSTKFYIEDWCKNRWLSRHYSEKDGAYVYRITADTEQAILFVEQNLAKNRRSFVGTESNFSKILGALTELAEKTQTDPKVREAQLIAERDKIDAQIAELRKTGKPQTLDKTAVKSRVFDLINMTNRFLADFRSVEDSFRRQRDEIQSLYLGQERSRGDIIETALDAVELLKDSDEGRSFFGFQKMLRSSEDVDNLRLLIEHSQKLAHEYRIDTGLLTGLIGRLLEEQNRAQQTYTAIARQLHVVVEESFQRDRRLLLDVVTEIKKHAHIARVAPPDTGIQCHLNPMVNPIMGLRWYEKKTTGALNTHINKDDENPDLSDFFRGIGHDLRMEAVREMIDAELKEQPQVSLSAILGKHELKHGAIDLLCFLYVAGRSERHQTLDQRIEVTLSTDPHRVARIPEIIYHRRSNG
jgi:hypothetical protein